MSVTDTGLGIPPDQAGAVFEEFRQLRQANGDGRQRGSLGSGLGLTISKRLIELHGGTMWAESEVGRGTTCSVTLPRADPVAALPDASAIEGRAATSRGTAGAAGVLGTLAVPGTDRRAVSVIKRYLDDDRVGTAPTSRHLRHLTQGAQVDAVLPTTSDTTAPARLPMTITVRLDSPEAAREAVSRPGVEARQGDDRTLEGRAERRADVVTWLLGIGLDLAEPES